YEDFTEIQFSFLPPSGAGLSVVKNAGSAEIRGIESEFAWAATDALTLTGGFSWLDAELTADYFSDQSATEPDAPRGTQLPVAPKFKSNLTARYTFPLGRFDGHVQGALVYNGSAWADLVQADRDIIGKQPSSTIVDLSAGIQRETYALELYV